MKRTIFLLLIILSAITVFSQTGGSKESYWKVAKWTTPFLNYGSVGQLVYCTDSAKLYALTASATPIGTLGTIGNVVVGDGSISGTGWSLTGNSGTIDGTNFIGTTDNVPLTFRVNNVTAGKIDLDSGNVYLGSGNCSYCVAGSSNTSIGQNAMQNNLGSFNTSLGYTTLIDNKGNNNIAIGYSAGSFQQNLSNRIYIGTQNRLSLAGDTTNSIIYGYEDAVSDKSRLSLNTNTNIKHDLNVKGRDITLAGDDTLFSTVITDSCFAATLNFRVYISDGTDRQIRQGTYNISACAYVGSIAGYTFTSSAVQTLTGGSTLTEALSLYYNQYTSTIYVIVNYTTSLSTTDQFLTYYTGLLNGVETINYK